MNPTPIIVAEPLAFKAYVSATGNAPTTMNPMPMPMAISGPRYERAACRHQLPIVTIEHQPATQSVRSAQERVTLFSTENCGTANKTFSVTWSNRRHA
jgi:hypothetical protein